jgi:hypothetical protein
MGQHIPDQRGRSRGVQYGRFRGITRLAFAATFFLLVIAAYRMLQGPPPSDSDEPGFEASKQPSRAGAPSVPPPPPAAEPAAQRKQHRMAPVPAGRIRADAGTVSQDPGTVREYATGDADPNPNAAPALADAAESNVDAANEPVFIVPPERPKQDSRGLRWIKAVGKALHVIPQKDAEDEAFRSSPGPNGE